MLGRENEGKVGKGKEKGLIYQPPKGGEETEDYLERIDNLVKEGKVGKVGDLDSEREKSNERDIEGISNLRQTNQQTKKKTITKVNPSVYRIFEEDMVNLLKEVKVSGILNKDKVYLSEDEVKDSLSKFLYLYVRPTVEETDIEYKERYTTILDLYLKEFSQSKEVYLTEFNNGLVYDVRV